MFRAYNFLIAVIFACCLAPTLSLADGKIAEFETQWQSISPGDSVDYNAWRPGKFANLGFTDSTLVMRSRLDGVRDRDLYLELSPVYIDLVDVKLSRADGSNISLHRLGDSVSQGQSGDLIRAPSRIYLRILPEVDTVEVTARSTSNLRLSTNFITEEELPLATQSYAFIASLLVTIIATAIVLASVAGLVYRSSSLLCFVLYQIAWLVLLAGLFYPLFAEPLWTSAVNHWVVSIGAIAATALGALAHAQIISEFSGTKLIPRILHVSAAAAILLLLLLALGHERVALQLNILIISTIPVLLIILLPWTKAKDSSYGIWGRIRFGYLILMTSVVVTGVSGLGVGRLFDITYIHALITTVLMSAILVMGLRHQTAKLRAQAQKSQLDNQRAQLLEDQLSESKSMFEMLSHEIKTPLTTLSMLLVNAQNRERAGRQIDAIRAIIEQTAIALNLGSLHSNPELHSLERVIIDNWQFIAVQADNQKLDLRVDPKVRVYADSLLLDILVRNLLKNAIKYSPPDRTIRVYTLNKDGDTTLVFSNESKIEYAEGVNFFRKYWRSADSSFTRGSGLGLWIVKRIAEDAGMNVDARLSQKYFRIVLTIPQARQQAI